MTTASPRYGRPSPQALTRSDTSGAQPDAGL